MPAAAEDAAIVVQCQCSSTERGTDCMMTWSRGAPERCVLPSVDPLVASPASTRNVPASSRHRDRGECWPRGRFGGTLLAGIARADRRRRDVRGGAPGARVPRAWSPPRARAHGRVDLHCCTARCLRMRIAERVYAPARARHLRRARVTISRRSDHPARSDRAYDCVLMPLLWLALSSLATTGIAQRMPPNYTVVDVVAL